MKKDNVNQVRQKTLGVFLNQARSSAGLTQKFAAEKLGYTSAQFVSNWERGISQPPNAVLPRVAELYNLDGAELVKAFHEFRTKCLNLEIVELERQLDLNNEGG